MERSEWRAKINTTEKKERQGDVAPRSPFPLPFARLTVRGMRSLAEAQVGRERKNGEASAGEETEERNGGVLRYRNSPRGTRYRHRPFNASNVEAARRNNVETNRGSFQVLARRTKVAASSRDDNPAGVERAVGVGASRRRGRAVGRQFAK